jgi:hypothetical protein
MHEMFQGVSEILSRDFAHVKVERVATSWRCHGGHGARRAMDAREGKAAGDEGSAFAWEAFDEVSGALLCSVLAAEGGKGCRGCGIWQRRESRAGLNAPGERGWCAGFGFRGWGVGLRGVRDNRS